ncbi:MAG: ATP-binding protein [Candidatus Dormibacteria bacterium]
MGPLQVDGVEQPRLGGRLQRAVLAALALRLNTPTARDRLIEGIWATPPASCVSTLHGYICHLREALRGTEFSIEFATGAYLLRGPRDALDASRFEALVSLAQSRLAEGGRPALRTGEADLRQALQLWAGEALEGLASLPLLRTEAARLVERRLEAETELLRCRLELGEDGSLVADLERAVGLNPYHEEIWALLVIALYREGRQAEALRDFRRARRRLAADLGLDPGALLAPLERMVLLHDPYLLSSRVLRYQQMPAPRPRSMTGGGGAPQLRPVGPPGQFVCRLEDLARLASLLLRQRLVTVVGPPGIGKSRLVAEYRRAASKPGAGGEWIQVEVRALQDEGELLGDVAGCCQVERGWETAEELAVALAERDAVIVFDGAEHLAPALAALCEHLLEACPRLRLLVTSRQALELDGEATLELGPLPVPDVAIFERQAVLRSAAVIVFLDKACPGVDSSEVPDEDLVTAAQICRGLDGIPLALELAGAAARTLPWRDLLGQLAPGLERCSGEGTGSGAGPPTLVGALEWSYRTLTPEQQRLLCALSVFEGAFDLAAAQVVGRHDKVGPLETAGLLAQLVARSLVARDRAPTGLPYRMLAPVRQFARSRALADPAGSGRVQRRQADHRLRRVG